MLSNWALEGLASSLCAPIQPSLSPAAIDFAVVVGYFGLPVLWLLLPAPLLGAGGRDGTEEEGQGAYVACVAEEGVGLLVLCEKKEGAMLPAVQVGMWLRGMGLVL